MVVSSPGQKPNEMTSCEYASRVTGSSLELPLGRPENRVTARSNPCQKRCTGLVLPLNQPLNSSRHGVRPVEDVAEAADRVVIPGGVLGVLRERCLHRDAEGLFEDLDVDSEVAEQAMNLCVEGRDRNAAGQRERLRVAVSASDDERVVEEVDRELESRALVVEPPRRQPADVDVERDVPPVITRRRRREPHLAKDLAVQVERVLGRAPVGEVELREIHGLDVSHGVKSSVCRWLLR